MRKGCMRGVSLTNRNAHECASYGLRSKWAIYCGGLLSLDGSHARTDTVPERLERTFTATTLRERPR
jgi:hypothetical protein